MTLPLLKLTGSDIDTIAVELAEKVTLVPDFFRNAPIIIDLQDLKENEMTLDFARFILILKQHGIVPVGVRGGSEALNKSARANNLATLSETRPEPKSKPEPRRKPAPERKPVNPPITQAANARLITRPVRSGQKAYAPGGDLIITAQVSAGAEVMADGNIHIYSTLRGRALAGVKGDLDCRIFCHDLQAELVSVGGHYQISENLHESKRGKPVQIYLQDEALIIEEI